MLKYNWSRREMLPKGTSQDMRHDIDEAKDEIIQLLESGMSRQTVCALFRCKTDTLKSRLRLWGYDHLKNPSGLGNPKYGARKPVTVFLTTNSSMTSHKLKKLLWRDGLKPKHCEECGWSQVSVDGRLPLELHHINGDRFDNCLENLAILCPNCHALKPNNSGCNAGKMLKSIS